LNWERFTRTRPTTYADSIVGDLAVVLIPLVANAVEPALGGNCPVCLVEMAKVVPGSDKHAVTFDRQVYYFPL